MCIQLRIGELLRAVPEQSTRAERARDEGEEKWTRVPSGSDDRSPKWRGFPNERHSSSSSQKERENHLITKSCDVVSCVCWFTQEQRTEEKQRTRRYERGEKKFLYVHTNII